MRFIEIFAEVIEKSLDEWALTAARYDSYLHTGFLDFLHDFLHTRENLGGRHRVEDVCLHIIHLLCFIQRDVDTLLLLHHHLDGVDTSGSLGGIGIGGSHVDVKLLHRLLPCYGMIGHTVIQYTIHIKKNGFRVEFPKAVVF